VVPSPEVKQPGHEADHSPPSSAKVKNMWSYTSTPQYNLMAWCLIKQWMHLHGIVLSQAQGKLSPLSFTFYLVLLSASSIFYCLIFILKFQIAKVFIIDIKISLND
jgi:hypothetical protein